MDLFHDTNLSDIPFDATFNTPQGQFLLYTHKKELFKLFKEFCAHEDIFYCTSSPEVIEELSRILKLIQSTKKILKVKFCNSLEVRQDLEKFYNEKIRKKGATTSLEYLKWFYSIDLSFQIPPYEHSSRSPMTVIKDFLNFLKESLKNNSFWTEPKDEKKGNESNFLELNSEVM
jgi:hypothetical protein